MHLHQTENTLAYMSRIQHDIWIDEEGKTSLCFAGELGRESRSVLDENCKIIYSFFASSHFDAMTQYYDYMKWGIYTTQFPIDKVKYNLNELQVRADWYKERIKNKENNT